MCKPAWQLRRAARNANSLPIACRTQITKILNLALSLPAGAVTTFDDGMSALEFTLVSCASSKTCDFSKADLPE